MSLVFRLFLPLPHQSFFPRSWDVWFHPFLIRQQSLNNPYYTYCANHPHRNHDRLEVPIGPMFVGDSTGMRVLWQPSPDSEEVRLALLDLLSHIAEQPQDEYPMGIYRDELVIWQLGEFREQRAVGELQRIINFNPDSTTGEPFYRTRISTVSIALEALQKIQDRNNA